MANLNWMGLGFSFGARDNGLKSAQDEAVRGFQKMDGAIGSVMAVAQRFTTQGMNLTTSLEAIRQQNSVTAKAMIGSAGLTEAATKKARKEAASLAESTGMGIQTTSEAAIAHARLVQQLGSEDAVTKQLGFTTEALSKFQTASGIKSEDFAATINTVAMQMKQTLKPGEDLNQKIKAFTEQLLFAADKSGGFTEGLGDLKEMQSMVNRAAATGTTDFEAWSNSINQAQMTMYKLVPNAKITRAAIGEFTEKIQESNESIQNMFSGTETDISKFTEGWAVMFQDINKSMGMLKKGPAEFMQTVGQAFLKTADGKGPEAIDKMLGFMQGRMSEVFGKDTATMLRAYLKNLSMGTGTAADKIKAMQAQFESGAMSIEDANKKIYAGSLTAEDVAKRAEQQLVARFRALTGSSWKFTKDFQKSTKEAGDILTRWAGESGPLGEFTRRMSRASKEGVAALFPPELAKQAQVASQIVTQMLGPLDNIKGLGQSILSLVSPFNLLAIAAGAVVTAFGANFLRIFEKIPRTFNAVTGEVEIVVGELPKAVALALSETLTQISKFISDVGPQVVAGLDGLITSIETFGNSPDLKKSIDTVGNVVNKLGELFSKLWHVIWIEHDLKGKTEAFWELTVKPWLKNTVGPIMQDIGTFLADTLVKALANINWKEVGATLWKGVKGVYNGIDTATDNTLGSKLGAGAAGAVTGAIGGAALSTLGGPLAPFLAGPLMTAGAYAGGTLGVGMSMAGTAATDWLAENAAQGWMLSDHAARGRTTEDQQSLARKAGVSASIKASDKPMVNALQAVASGQVVALDDNTRASMGVTKSNEELVKALKELASSQGSYTVLNLPPGSPGGSLANRAGMTPRVGT